MVPGGAEHLLYGLDHLLFLLALIVGSRRLREIVLTASTFTLAHSVTFVLAAVGLVEASSGLVEPLIAASIAFVAGWYLWRVWRRGSHAADLEGIDEPWSWKLLSSLLIFNLGIEAVQLTIIAIVFPVLVFLRHRSPRGEFWTSVIASAAVALTGTVWFVERTIGT